jgi:KamA family protein
MPQKKMKFYGINDIDKIPQLQALPEDERFAMKVVSHVLPFRSNNYVVDELIDWGNIPDDPIFQLTFMQRDMLEPAQFNKIADALKAGLGKREMEPIVREVRLDLNPHPAGQLSANVPKLDDEPVRGVQHKYRETCLVFPSPGQTCFAYCTFCFRWPQFVGYDDLKFATDESMRFQGYIRENKQITDVLFTGGDPMIMSAKKLAKYIEPLLEPGFEHIRTIRIGTKALGYWPYRFFGDKDSDDVMRVLEKVVAAGKHLAIMAHYNHWVELETDAVQEAHSRLRSLGAQIRTQSPLLRHINDDADVWARMWRTQVNQGIIPYYMFVERDTGPRDYFAMPLERAYHIYRDAIQQTSGLARTARGPSMSCFPGKVALR